MVQALGEAIKVTAETELPSNIKASSVAIIDPNQTKEALLICYSRQIEFVRIGRSGLNLSRCDLIP